MLDIFNKAKVTELQSLLTKCREKLAETEQSASAALSSSSEELVIANLTIAQLKLELQCSETVPVAGKQAWHINSAGTAAVSDTQEFLPIGSDTPKGPKVLLLGPGGAAVISPYNGESFWKGWAPLPGVNSNVLKPGV